MKKDKTANKYFVLCSLLFVLCIASCGEETEVHTDGRLTITGLADYNGQEIFARGKYRLIGNPFDIKLDAYGRAIENPNGIDNWFPGKISSDQATLNVYKGVSSWENYNGNDQNVKFAVVIVGKAYGTVTVNFTNGIASGVFFDEWADSLAVTWHLNGGSKGTGKYANRVINGKKLDRPSPDPTKVGYFFSGWYTDSALTQTYNFTNNVTADFNLYAKWEEPLELYGTWLGRSSDYLNYILTVSATSVRLENTSGDYYTQYSNVSWTPAANTDSYYSTQYPNGFNITGNRSGSASSLEIGFIALSTNGQSVCLGYGGYSTVIIFAIFEKTP